MNELHVIYVKQKSVNEPSIETTVGLRYIAFNSTLFVLQWIACDKLKHYMAFKVYCGTMYDVDKVKLPIASNRFVEFLL